MRRTTELRLITGFILIFGVLCVNAIVLTNNMQVVTRNRQRVERSHEVAEALDAVFSTIQDAETGQRGFLLSGKEYYLAPYNAARENINQRLAELRELTRGDALQSGRLAEIQQYAALKLSELQETIDLRRSGQQQAALGVVRTDRGKGYMDSIRTLKTEMKNTEQRLLATREVESRVSERTTRATFSGATVAGLILLVIVHMVILRSIAERRRFADDLQKREEWLSTTLRSIGDAVIATDSSGAILFMNGVAEQLTGWTQKDAAGKNAKSVFIIVNETTRDTVTSPIDQVVEENRIVSLANHTILLSKDGTESYIDDSGAPIRDSSGALIGVVLVFRDISERKAAQKERERYLAQVEAVNGRLQRAVTETHHRVKNNLQLVASMVALHSEEGDGTLSASEVRRLGSNINTLAAVQDVLTNASKRDGDVIEISASELLAKLVSIHQHAAPRHKITSDFAHVRLPGAQGTALALLANELLSNAIKHGKSAVYLSLHLNASENALEMCVTDDGPGFKDGFDPADAANTGLELILSLAKWDLRGELSFSNTRGGGEVRLTMPVPVNRASAS